MKSDWLCQHTSLGDFANRPVQSRTKRFRHHDFREVDLCFVAPLVQLLRCSIFRCSKHFILHVVSLPSSSSKMSHDCIIWLFLLFISHVSCYEILLPLPPYISTKYVLTAGIVVCKLPDGRSPAITRTVGEVKSSCRVKSSSKVKSWSSHSRVDVVKIIIRLDCILRGSAMILQIF